MIRRPPRSPLFPYTPLSRSSQLPAGAPASMTWYFDAGSVGNSFQEYLTIQNPDPSLAASITITYLVQTNPPTTRTVQHTVFAGSRPTFAAGKKPRTPTTSTPFIA